MEESPKVRGRCDAHQLALGPDGGCVLCRRGAEAPAPRNPNFRRAGIAIGAVSLLCGGLAFAHGGGGGSHAGGSRGVEMVATPPIAGGTHHTPSGEGARVEIPRDPSATLHGAPDPGTEPRPAVDARPARPPEGALAAVPPRPAPQRAGLAAVPGPAGPCACELRPQAAAPAPVNPWGHGSAWGKKVTWENGNAWGRGNAWGGGERLGHQQTTEFRVNWDTPPAPSRPRVVAVPKNACNCGGAAPAPASRGVWDQ